MPLTWLFGNYTFEREEALVLSELVITFVCLFVKRLNRIPNAEFHVIKICRILEKIMATNLKLNAEREPRFKHLIRKACKEAKGKLRGGNPQVKRHTVKQLHADERPN